MKFRTGQLIIAMIISAAWMVFRYFIFEYKIGSLLFANEDFRITAAVLNLPGNIIQSTVSAAAALPFILAIKKQVYLLNCSICSGKVQIINRQKCMKIV